MRRAALVLAGSAGLGLIAATIVVPRLRIEGGVIAPDSLNLDRVAASGGRVEALPAGVVVRFG